MSSRWRVIDCSCMEGQISSERGAICIQPNGSTPTSLPVSDVAVVLIGMKVRFSAAALHRLLKEDIAVIVCDWKGVPEGAAYGWQSHSRVGARHLAQVKLSRPRQKNAWGKLVKAKVLGQSAVLSALNISSYRRLRKLASSVRSGDPENIEAQAARLYWQSLWSEEEFSRMPGQGNSSASQRNAHLDYGYTVLRGHVIRATLAAGLSPSIGLFHRNRSNYFNLVDDLIEPFRPAVDIAVAELDDSDLIEDPAVRKHLVAASSQQFLDNGLTVSSAVEELAINYAHYVEGEAKSLVVPEWMAISERYSFG